jgi:membrane fusion protein, multidrug efflux system
MVLYFLYSILWLLLLTTAQFAPAQVAVMAEQVQKQHIVDTVTALGTTKANESIYITPKMTEIIAQILFKEGQHVKKGQLLVQLDASEELAKLKEAELDVAEQQREYQRLERLVQQKAVPSSQLDMQSSRLKAAMARVETAKIAVDDRRIVAPFNGKLGLRQVSVGALVNAGQVITTLDDIEQIKLDFTVPEIYLANLNSEMALAANSAAYPQRVFTGQVATIDSRVDAISRMVALRAVLPNLDQVLRPGMLLTVTLKVNPRMALVISERAIVPLGSEQFVYVLQTDNTVTRRKINIGLRLVGFVEVLSGLTETDLVITEGTIRLRDGMSVKLN